MFLSDQSLEPGSSDLLTELGIDPLTVREVIDHDRAIRCPDHAAVFPAYGFATLTPEPLFAMALQDAAADEPWGPTPSFPQPE